VFDRGLKYQICCEEMQDKNHFMKAISVTSWGLHPDNMLIISMYYLEINELN
jgi:hypothetical protein